MTWDDFMAARQLLVEEHIGVIVREVQRAEEEKVETTKAEIRKTMGLG